MTAERHRTVGRVLGFPWCCIEAFIRDLGNYPAVQRGSVVERARTPVECADIAQRLGWERWDSDPFKRYVPCLDHVGSPGWKPWTGEIPEDYEDA